MICGILSRTSLPWLIAALPAVRGSCDPAISIDSGIVDARGLRIPENTRCSGYFRYLAAQRRDDGGRTARIQFLAEIVVLDGAARAWTARISRPGPFDVGELDLGQVM